MLKHFIGFITYYILFCYYSLFVLPFYFTFISFHPIYFTFIYYPFGLIPIYSIIDFIFCRVIHIRFLFLFKITCFFRNRLINLTKNTIMKMNTKERYGLLCRQEAKNLFEISTATLY